MPLLLPLPRQRPPWLPPVVASPERSAADVAMARAAKAEYEREFEARMRDIAARFVGRGATVTLADGCKIACTIVEFWYGCTVTEDSFRVVSGHRYDIDANYEFTPNPAGRRWNFEFVPGSGWREGAGDATITFGQRELVWPT